MMSRCPILLLFLGAMLLGLPLANANEPSPQIDLQTAISGTYSVVLLRVNPDPAEGTRCDSTFAGGCLVINGWGNLVLEDDRYEFIFISDADVLEYQRSRFWFIREPQGTIEIRYHPPYTEDTDLAMVPQSEFLATIDFDPSLGEEFDRTRQFLIHKLGSSLCFHSVASELQLWGICQSPSNESMLYWLPKRIQKKKDVR